MLGHIKAYHLATQGDAVQIHTMARMHLEDRMLRERRQPPKTVHCLFPFVSSVQNKANPETESLLDREEMVNAAKGYGVSVWCDENVLKLMVIMTLQHGTW